jgi:flagellar basal body P-ring formation protein FlgA
MHIIEITNRFQTLRLFLLCWMRIPARPEMTNIRRSAQQTTYLLSLFVIFLVTWNASGQASSPVYQSHTQILEAARQHLLEKTSGTAGTQEIELTPLDHRIKLNRCSSPLETFTPAASDNRGKVTVGVQCNAENPWKIYVTANVGIEGPVVIAKRDLSRGSVIGEEDVRVITRDTNHLLRGHFETAEQVVGRTLKRNLRREQVITPSLLLVQKTISRGQMITILAGNSGIEVRMKGKALRNGNPGDLIPVQNLPSKKKLEARVVAAGEVRIE